MIRNTLKALGTVMMAGLVLTACDQGAVAPESTSAPDIAFDFGPDGLPGLEEFEVCKIGTSANFDWKIDGVAQTGFSLNDGDCVVLHQVGGAGATVEVFERTQDFTNEQLDQVLVEVLDQTGTTGPFAGTNPYSDLIGGGGVANGPRGVTVTFHNSFVPTGGGEGCTPGYWKNHAGAYSHSKGGQNKPSAWEGYLPTDSYDAVFGVTSSYGAGFRLIDALDANGGGEAALARHAVAALLSAAHSGVSYDLTTGEVISGVQSAYAGGTFDDFNAQKDVFAPLNEQGCPL